MMSYAWVYCRCCYSTEGLEELCGPLLDVYSSIYRPQGLKNHNTGIIACLKCREFLKEVHRFRIEGHRLEKSSENNRDIKPLKVEFILRSPIQEISSHLPIKAEVKDEYVEINEVDVEINNEVYSNSQNMQMVRDSMKSNEGNLLIELYHSENRRLDGNVNNKEESHCSTSNTSNGIVKRLCTPYESLQCPERLFECDNCTFKCQRQLDMIVHQIIHPKRVPINKNDDINSPKSRRRRATNMLYCDHCNYSNKNKELLSIHLNKHLDCNKGFKCSECSYTAMTMPHLKRHLSSHSDIKPFSCNQCNYRSKRKDHLKIHMRNHLNDTDKPYQCSECSFTTTTMSHLKYHVAYKHSDEKPFGCDLCGRRFKRKDYLSIHVRKHMKISDSNEKPKPHKCSECSYATATFDHLKRHTLNHFNQKRFSCDHCNYRSNRKDHLTIHLRKHLSETELPYKCNECSFKTTTLSGLKYHVASRHTFDKLFTCDHCNKCFKFKNDLTRHQKIHVKDKSPFKCSECSYTTTTSKILDYHITTLHNDSKPYKCNECLYVTTTSRNLKHHFASMHSVDRPFACDQCEFSSVFKPKLIKHQQTHMKDRVKPYKCSECSYETMTNAYLQDHVARKHSDEKPFSCDECNYRCKIKYELNQHKKTHLKDCDKPFQCSECSYVTTAMKYLKRHMFKHTDVRPYTCERCDYGTHSKFHLSRHMEKHSKDTDKPYKCSECSYRAKTAGNLSKHVGIHLNDGDKPFKCSDCSYATNKKGSLKSHVALKHTDEKPFSCEECDYRCKLKTHLSAHKKIHLKERSKPT